MLAVGIQLNPILNYQQWRFSWYAFLNLLDIDYSSGFTCGRCGQYPQVLTCDATSLGFRKTFQKSGIFEGRQAASSLEGR